MKKFREIPTYPEMKEEEKRPETKVILHFMRHQEKDKSLPGQSNRNIQLTKRGRQSAINKSLDSKTEPEVSWAAGSDRVRSGHTALLQMASEKAGFTADMSYNEAKAEIEKEMSYGEKVITLPELDFMWEGTEGFKKAGYQAYKEGRVLDFLVKESDELVKELKDMESVSYSRQAAGYASLIAREMRVGNNFNRIASKKPDKYENFNNTIERYFGTHQAVSECFYMKVLEKTQCDEAVYKFIESLKEKNGDGNGFGFQEGYDITIVNSSEGQKIILDGIYGFNDIELTSELLINIIKDVEVLDGAIE